METPGQQLKKRLDSYNVTAYALSKAIGKAQIQISKIINKGQRITPEMSILIGIAIGSSPGYWLNIQSNYDIETTMREVRIKHYKKFPQKIPHDINKK